MTNVETGRRRETLEDSMAELWQLRPPGPDNLLAAPAFTRLRDFCVEHYPNSGKMGFGFALSHALRSLGLLCTLRPGIAKAPALSLEDAARRLDQSLRATSTHRLYLAPLDLADRLPNLTFGPARMQQFTEIELCELFDHERLARLFPQEILDARRFSQFHWLVVEEQAKLETEPEVRAIPIFFEDFGQDFGRIEPHKSRFPSLFEHALFFVLLAPWEIWAQLRDVDWRGFRIPWVYTAYDDLFVLPKSVPSADTLTWEERLYTDAWGVEEWLEVPCELHLSDRAASELIQWDDDRWHVIARAIRSPLFETPVVHFFVRAFLAEGVDEFLAHITTIEAALGLPADYNSKLRSKPDAHKGMRATERLKSRLAGLLGNVCFGEQYATLFDLRSAYLHGRKMENPISTDDRILARSLARQVVDALAQAVSDREITSRERFLDELLSRGAQLINGNKK